MHGLARFYFASILLLSLCGCAQSNPAADSVRVSVIRCAPDAGKLSEEKFISIGGIDQWVTISGTSCENPVVLYVHGGPGNAMSPFADSMFGSWKKNFTVVQWDQRGAGRTYSKNGPSIEPTMTIDRMVKDGIEVAEYLTKYLGKQKIILVGESWGSILGIQMVKQRPDLFHAYVGVSQFVNTRANHIATYMHLLDLARANDDQQTVKDLESIGPPPWNPLNKWKLFRKAILKYEPKRVTAMTLPLSRSPEYSSPSELASNEEADDFSFIHFEGMTMSGPEEQVDLPALGTSFAVPIYIVQGQEDLKAVPELAKSYFESIHAPQKQFIIVPGTGHPMSVERFAIISKLLLDDIRPEAVRVDKNKK